MRLAVSILLTAAAGAQGLPEIENNDTLSAATLAIDTGWQVYGRIGGPFDPAGPDLLDVYPFTLTVAQDIRAWTAPGISGAIGDTRLELRDANGQLLLEVDDGAVATHGFYSSMLVGNVAPGSYALVVRGWQAATVGSYTLDFITGPVGSLQPRLAARPTFSGNEPNDPRLPLGIATASAVDTRNEGVLGAGGSGGQLGDAGADYDFFAFTVPTAGVVTLAVGAPVLLPGPALADSVVWLLGSNMNVLAANDDHAGSAHARLWHFVRPGNLYYAVIAGKTAADAGAYSLEVMGPAAPTGSPAAVMVSPAHPGCQGSGAPIELGVRTDATNGFLVRPEQPIIGSFFCLDVRNVLQGPVYTLYGPQLLPSGILLDLLGWPGCYTEINYQNTETLYDVLPQHNSSMFFWNQSIPRAAILAGVSFHVQAAGTDPQGGIALSNRCTLICGMHH